MLSSPLWACFITSLSYMGLCSFLFTGTGGFTPGVSAGSLEGKLARLSSSERATGLTQSHFIDLTVIPWRLLHKTIKKLTRFHVVHGRKRRMLKEKKQMLSQTGGFDLSADKWRKTSFVINLCFESCIFHWQVIHTYSVSSWDWRFHPADCEHLIFYAFNVDHLSAAPLLKSHLHFCLNRRGGWERGSEKRWTPAQIQAEVSLRGFGARRSCYERRQPSGWSTWRRWASWWKETIIFMIWSC